MILLMLCGSLLLYDFQKLYPTITVRLLEYDKHFDQYGSDFTFYDYNHPEDLPLELKHNYQVVIADPPYLSKECLEKVAQKIYFLAHLEESFLLLLTGEVQTDRAADLLGLRPCNFRPQHSSKLGNEFRLFTNYDPLERLGGWVQEK
ncbi:EEF1A lysine methyltransferase 1-like [Hibiscus syriacus]|uniref:EEF1A lysine methyltransferase 1-like n=1 Tax=Hibiscus syriacus TaxID=106335 RepID=UPI001922D24D|nr:EEF1A lysine methyltransferase 1-like [Hibiscus syriacus]